MMIATLLILHLMMLALLFRQMEAHVGRILGLVFLVYMLAFTVIKPALLYYYDLFLPYSTNDESAVSAMLTGSLLFLAIQYFALRLLAFRPTPAYFRTCFDFSQATPRGIWIMFAVFMAISFVGSIIRFQTLGYLWSSESTFDATTRQAGGSWYINYLAELLVFGMTVAMAYQYSRYRIFKSFLILMGLLVVTYIWSKLAARTGVLVALIVWLACSFTPARQKAINVLYISAFGYVLLVLLYVGNFVRLGNVDSIDPSTALFGAVVAAAADLQPIDNSVLLYSEMDKHPSTEFVELIGSITPMVLVPSAIFPLKIPPDKDSELTRIFFPEGADTTFYHEGSTLTFTVPGSGYADEGYWGVLAASIVYAYLLCLYVRIFRGGTPSARFIAANYLVVHIVGYRLSVETILVVFYTALLFVGFAKWIALTFSGPRQPVVVR